MTRALVFVLSCLVVLTGAAALGQRSLGARAMKDSDLALASGRSRAAAVFARQAAECPVPGSPYARDGYARLDALAMAAEVEGRLDDAAFAWRAMRSAAVATRPAAAGRGKVARADEGILRVARARSGSAPERLLRAQLEEHP